MANTTQVTLGLIQTTCSPDKRDNLASAEKLIREAAGKGAQIICLQELFATRYFCQQEVPEHFALAETIPGPTTQKLCALAKELETVIVAPLFEKRAQGIYHNAAVVVDADGTIAGRYRKMHIPDDPGFHEKFYFTPGDQGFLSFQTRYARVGVLICWDQWFPEAARLTALSGAQILFYPTAIGFRPPDREESIKQAAAWKTIQKSHAIANGVFVASANRVGREDEIEFWGQSFVCGPFGESIAEAGSGKEEILIAQCDLGEIDSTRQNWPFLRDRRVDAYQDIGKLYIDPDAS